MRAWSPKQVIAPTAVRSPRSRRASISSVPDIAGIRMSVITSANGSPAFRADRAVASATLPSAASSTR